MTSPLVSIIIRARNEAPALRRLLPLLQSQEVDFPFDIWLLDNDSQDESATLARAYGLRYHHIPRGGFNYAAALNLGASLAEGEFIVSLSAHCFPQRSDWLAALVAPLRADRNVVAAYGRQVIDPQSGAFEAHGNAELFPADARQPKIVAFSNANSAIRRDYLLIHPFNPAIKILEDHLFYLEIAGDFDVVYVPEAVVLHEHDRFSWRYYVRRWILEGWSFYFLTRHRGLPSPYIPQRLVSLRRLLFIYPRIAVAYARRGRWAPALRAIPFFWLRDLIWLASFVRARLLHPVMAQTDTALLLRTNRFLRRQAMQQSRMTLPDAPLDWREEWQLKADWGFIRRNIADFIRLCHERGLFASPLLEVGASGQNDYLAEWYDMRTSNLASNLHSADMALDMEDMRQIADNSLGSILCSEVIEHVRHPERAIAEAFRVLRPGGTLIITTPYNIVIHNTPEDGGFHGRNFTPQGLELILREAGFDIVLLETRGATEMRRRLMPSNVFAVARKPG
ncbi:glycosyltransferase [Roseiflexus castenholzii]|uniref:Glycosyl transferase family 2 n=1 Tax=Roseiflexus castenholzii (strain DSM 13941 / HLO8) TaxID=383372 RepID=A7NQ49_ROSCS|nr:glycosyltransferase [Roseiflexus castenholzii]ABU59695.1 glycosyl transferase family 2 [Roseiflexus castenholzii DSM 13941]